MFIHIDDHHARKRLLAFLRQRGYLAVEKAAGVEAHPLNPVSDRYDRSTLLALLDEWKTSQTEDTH